jgi:hypothetical protein
MDEREKKERERLIAYLEKIAAGLKSVYGNAYADALKLTDVKNAIKNGESFTWKGNPIARRKLDALLKTLSGQTENLIRNGITGSWKMGESAVKDAVLNEFGKGEYGDDVNKTIEQAVVDQRASGMNAHRFATQKRGGMNLSERVWNLTGEAKNEIERLIQSRIAEGKSADDVSRDIRKYLNEPERSTKTVPVPVRDKAGNIVREPLRDENGNILKGKDGKPITELKDAGGKVIKQGKAVYRQEYVDKEMNDYHPGRGVYRSAYKNALRLARTEINAAYRRAEWEGYQKNPLIKGYKIMLSNNHTTLKNGKPVPFTDICDELQGEYPKSFLWEGWHPQCRCRMVPIMISVEEFGERVKARKDGKLEAWKPKEEIKEPPKALNEWGKKNEERIARAKQLPYWMMDNTKFLSFQLNQIKPDSPPSNMDTKQLFSLYKEFTGGGKVEIMKGYTPKSDHKDLRAIARYFSQKGDKVQITTSIHFKNEKYKEVFGRLNGTPYERKCPDLIINGEYYEYESFVPPFKKEKISHMIKKGFVQSSRVIINNNKGASDRYIRDNIYKRLKDKNFKYEIKEIWIYEKGKVRLLYKKQ